VRGVARRAAAAICGVRGVREHPAAQPRRGGRAGGGPRGHGAAVPVGGS
jgi:hypothetical protein